MSKPLTRSRVAKIAGCSVNTIDHYSREGLIQAAYDPKQQGKAREFSVGDVFQILLVKQLFKAGIGIEDIREYVSSRLNPVNVGFVRQKGSTKREVITIYDHGDGNISIEHEMTDERGRVRVDMGNCQRAIVIDVTEIRDRVEEFSL
ncbi:MerR family transcriptional regulator [Desulfatibacillum aliphaticivorans]|uniref:MerR family transcriptional regulator n=1 Tax=Desulfatibacillum aliphaticivorans TaxID=218208 RepID=UPI0005C21689|nr:MerR family transcriptional regulator [Desulfatibacillum aliphaticivorans]